jgi:hypothetical protein
MAKTHESERAERRERGGDDQQRDVPIHQMAAPLRGVASARMIALDATPDSRPASDNKAPTICSTLDAHC